MQHATDVSHRDYALSDSLLKVAVALGLREKAVAGNVGHVGKRGLTCTLYVGTMVALLFWSARRKRVPTCRNRHGSRTSQLVALRWRTGDDLRKWRPCVFGGVFGC